MGLSPALSSSARVESPTELLSKLRQALRGDRYAYGVSGDLVVIIGMWIEVGVVDVRDSEVSGKLRQQNQGVGTAARKRAVHDSTVSNARRFDHAPSAENPAILGQEAHLCCLRPQSSRRASLCPRPVRARFRVERRWRICRQRR